MVCPLTAWGQDVWDGTTKDESWYDASKDEFTISTAAELAGLAQLVNAGTDFSGKTIYLDADIQLNNTDNWENWGTTAPANSWTAIGNSTNKFKGIFDGQGHTISGIYISNNSDYQGLFGHVGEGGTIQNLSVTASYIKAGSTVGGIVGYNSAGTVSNCSNSGKVAGSGIYNSYIGGIVGNNNAGTIESCFNSGTVTGEGTKPNVGGIAGINYGSGATVKNCSNSGEVIGNNANSCGGIAGINYIGAIISNCSNNGTVTGTGNAVRAGGITGENTSSSVSKSYYLEQEGLQGIGYGGTTSSEEEMKKTEEEYESGEVAHLLDPDGDTWGQDFGKGYPMPLGCLSEEEREASKVYTITLTYPTSDGNEKTETIHGNSDTPITPPTAPEGYTYTWTPELPTTFGYITGEGKYTGTLTEIEEPEPEAPDTPVIPDMPKYYNIMVEECEGVTVETSTNVVHEGQSMTFTIDIAEGYTDENMTVKVKRSLFGYTEVIEPNNEGIYEVKNIYTDIYLTVDGVEEEEEAPTGMEDIEGAKVYTKDGSIYVQTPTQEQVQIISISGAVLKNETQIGLHRYDLPRGIYIICIDEQRFKVRN